MELIGTAKARASGRQISISRWKSQRTFLVWLKRTNISVFKALIIMSEIMYLLTVRLFIRLAEHSEMNWLLYLRVNEYMHLTTLGLVRLDSHIEPRQLLNS